MRGRGIAAVVLASLLLGHPAGLATAAEYLQTLREGTWICVSPQAYDQAIQEERAWEGGNPEELRKDLLDRKMCMYLDAEWAGNLMAPFAIILERHGTKVKVQFTVEFRKRIEFLHRQINRVTYVGWTESANLLEKEIL